ATLKPPAPDCGGNAEQHEEQCEHPAEIELAPVAARRKQRVNSPHGLLAEGGCSYRTLGKRFPVCTHERSLQGLPEHAEAVGHTDAEMNGERGRWHQPAVIAGVRDNARFVEKAGMVAGRSRMCSRHP